MFVIQKFDLREWLVGPILVLVFLGLVNCWCSHRPMVNAVGSHS